MGLIIDTGVFVQWERSHRAIDFSQWADYGEAAVSAITASELLVGVHRANTDARRERRSKFVELILAQIPILDFNLDVARMHADLFAALCTMGTMIGPHDLIIAATARYHSNAVLTTNGGEFRQVPDLIVIDLAS